MRHARVGFEPQLHVRATTSLEVNGESVEEKVSRNAGYDTKFGLLNRNMRWEVAGLLRERNLQEVNSRQKLVVPRNSFYTRVAKRGLDIVLSSVALLFTLPINALLAVAVFCDVGKPLLFVQQRLGKDGESFTLVKFRTMRDDVDENGHPLLGDKRVTRIGRMIRRTSLDEFLNFWSIFKGDMSLIGPRPLLMEYEERLSDRHAQRMAVRPGLACPPRKRLDHVETYDEQFENDVWYVSTVSFGTDLMMLLRLVEMVFDHRQTSSRAASLRGAFMGYDSEGRALDSFEVPHWALDEILDRHGLLEEETD